MSLPVTVPFAFGNATTAQSLSSLDTNFTTITNSINGLTNGASQINVASITATGTANSTTYLRGDGAWAAVSGGGGSGTVTSIDVNGGTTGLTATGGPVTTSGNITIAGTLIPANGGTGLTSVGASGNVLTSNGTAWISQAPTTALQSAKAWAVFNGTSSSPITPAASYNISSITKSGTGLYTLSFTSAMADANYAILITGQGIYAPNFGPITAVQYLTTPSTTSFSIQTQADNGTLWDLPRVSVLIFGN